MAHDSVTLGGTMRQVARDQASPACYEGRVSRLRPSGVLEVTVRGLTGDIRSLPARCYRPRVVQGDDGLELLDAVQGDSAWIAEDEGHQFVVIDWEPQG